MEELAAILEQIDLTGIDIQLLLDNRDSAPFDCEWMRVYNEIEALKNESGYSEKDKKYNARVRENVFKRIYARLGDSELAAYVSDDWGLIVDSRILKYSDAWLEQLICSYQNGTIPGGSL